MSLSPVATVHKAKVTIQTLENSSETRDGSMRARKGCVAIESCPIACPALQNARAAYCSRTVLNHFDGLNHLPSTVLFVRNPTWELQSYSLLSFAGERHWDQVAHAPPTPWPALHGVIISP
jgi:hypothetical protein